METIRNLKMALFNLINEQERRCNCFLKEYDDILIKEQKQAYAFIYQRIYNYIELSQFLHFLAYYINKNEQEQKALKNVPYNDIKWSILEEWKTAFISIYKEINKIMGLESEITN